MFMLFLFIPPAEHNYYFNILIPVFLVSTRLFHSYTDSIETININKENKGKLIISLPKYIMLKIDGIPTMLTKTRDLFEK